MYFLIKKKYQSGVWKATKTNYIAVDKKASDLPFFRPAGMVGQVVSPPLTWYPRIQNLLTTSLEGNSNH